MNERPIGRMLRAYRFTERLTVEQCAAQIGTSKATLSRIERGHDPDARTLLRLLTWMFGEPQSVDAVDPAGGIVTG